MKLNRIVAFDETRADEVLTIVEDALKSDKRFRMALWRKAKKSIRQSMELYSTNRALWDILGKSEFAKEDKFYPFIKTLRTHAAHVRGSLEFCNPQDTQKSFNETFESIGLILNQLENEFELYRELRKGPGKTQRSWRSDQVFNPIFTRRFYRIIRTFTSTQLKAKELTGLIFYFLETGAVSKQIRDTQTVEDRLTKAAERIVAGARAPTYITEHTFKLLTEFVQNN